MNTYHSLRTYHTLHDGKHAENLHTSHRAAAVCAVLRSRGVAPTLCTMLDMDRTARLVKDYTDGMQSWEVDGEKVMVYMPGR